MEVVEVEKEEVEVEKKKNIGKSLEHDSIQINSRDPRDEVTVQI